MRWMIRYDLVLGMFALAVTAVMLVAGELYLVTRPDQPKTFTPPAVDSNIIHPVTWLPARKRILTRRGVQ